MRKYHERCRLPGKMLATWSCAKPMVLKNGGNPGTVPALSPPSSSLSPPSSNKALPVEDATASMSSNSIVDSILEKRKMRKRVHVRELDKRPPPKRKTTAYEKLTEENRHAVSMIMTPGLPMLTEEEASEALMQGANYGNFRRQTLLRWARAIQ